jgi:hypothetical protein
MAYGLSASAVGNDFPWVFNPPATYWDGLSMIFRYIGGKEGGLDKLKGKTIGFIFFDGGYGREPIPLLEQYAKDYGFEVKLYPVPAAEMQSQTPKEKVGESHYNKGVYNSVMIAESIRNAQKLTGKKIVTGEDVRRGLETMNITAARWKELGLPEFGSPLAVSCADHNGHQAAYVMQWDGAKWSKVSDWISPMKEKVTPLLDAAAADYVSKNQPWPKRTEPCDKAS